jgi:4-hydroxybenzoate polyprenyltransferase
MLCYASYLAIWGAALLGRLPAEMLALATAAAGAQAVWHYTLIRDRGRDGCFKAFRLNHWVGFALFVGVVAGYASR